MVADTLTAHKNQSAKAADWGIAARFNHWLLERVRLRRGSPALPFKLEYRHIYVMPTMFGVWFGILLAVTLLGGLNFNNNMALLIGFLLAAIAVRLDSPGPILFRQMRHGLNHREV